MRLTERVEHHHFVNTVDEFGTEIVFHIGHHSGFHSFIRRIRTQFLNVLAADVARHHHHGVFEVHRAALAVGQAAVIQYLQQDIEHVRMRFFHFIQQNHAVRFAAHLLGQIAALFVAHIARRRANQPRNAVFFHVFRHIHAD